MRTIQLLPNGITRASQQITTLHKPEELENAGVPLGLRHDRQNLGILLAPGEKIKIRQVNHNYPYPLTFRLLNKGHLTEKTVILESSEMEVSHDITSIPFIDTPEPGPNGEVPVLEFEYPSSAVILPVYQKGTDTQQFFEQWDSSDADFALIESDYIIIMVPKIDKEKLRPIIDRVIPFYDDLFNFYNQLAGFSGNELVRARCFVKADEDASTPYYDPNKLTAVNGKTVFDFWLNLSPAHWGDKNEIAHSYEGSVSYQDSTLADGIRSTYFNGAEVINNVFAACFQQAKMDEKTLKYQGWLYHGGVATELIINSNFKKSIPVNDWDLPHRLYFLMLMLEKGGTSAFTRFMQEYRKMCVDPSKRRSFDVLGRFSAHLAENQVDVTPFIQLSGGQITPAQVERNHKSSARAVYPLYQLIQSDYRLLESITNQLNLKSTLALVDIPQLKATGLKGNATVQLDEEDFQQIVGQDLILMDGPDEVRRIKINSSTLELGDLPIGVYKLHLPTDMDYKPVYLVVKEGNNTPTHVIAKKPSQSIISQKIILLGLGDAPFGEMFVDYRKMAIAININSGSPHVYFKDNYAKIIVRDTNNNVVFTKEMNGAFAQTGKYSIPFSIGYKIEISHKEPSRIRIPSDPVMLTFDPTNILIITPNGLKNEQRQRSPIEALKQRIEDAIYKLLDLKRDPLHSIAKENNAKGDILLAISTLPVSQRSYLLEKYRLFSA